jgi:DNA-binding transcriptional ArsR family regulator
MTAMSIKESAESRSTFSRSWRWLESRGLVQAHRDRRDHGIEILKEDGSGQEWATPGLVGDPYLRFPVAYWTGAFARDLSLPAKAVLLIGLSRQSRGQAYFELPLKRGAAWYGISPSTVRRGLDELRDIHLLRRWANERETAASPTGYTYDQRYALNSMVNVADQSTSRNHDGFDLDAGEDIPF